MRLNKTFILLVAAMLSLPAAADDFGLWPEVGIEKKLGRFSVEASAGMRFDDAVSRLTRTDLGVGVDYKLLKFLKLGVGYDFIRDYTGPEEEVHYNSSKGMNGYDVKQSYWRTKHRFHFDATGKYRVGRFTFSLRERYQLTRNMAVTVTENKYRGIVSDPATYEGATYQGSFNDNVYAYRESKTKEKDARTKHFLRSRLGGRAVLSRLSPPLRLATIWQMAFLSTNAAGFWAPIGRWRASTLFRWLMSSPMAMMATMMPTPSPSMLAILSVFKILYSRLCNVFLPSLPFCSSRWAQRHKLIAI